MANASSTPAEAPRRAGSRSAPSIPARRAKTLRAYPASGQILFPPTGISESEILLCYGVWHFASKAGQLARNPFLTIVGGRDNLRPLGELTLWHGAQKVERGNLISEASLG